MLIEFSDSSPLEASSMSVTFPSVGCENYKSTCSIYFCDVQTVPKRRLVLPNQQLEHCVVVIDVDCFERQPICGYYLGFESLCYQHIIYFVLCFFILFPRIELILNLLLSLDLQKQILQVSNLSSPESCSFVYC